ncbi:MAG: 50S ribosomal protein L23 [Lentisphaerota bacterium]
MKDAQQIIKQLLMTEKGTRLTETLNQYLFWVDSRANKIEIKSAVEAMFKVKVQKVNTMNRVGKNKRVRTMSYGKTSDWKRAVVTLREGEKIDLT